MQEIRLGILREIHNKSSIGGTAGEEAEPAAKARNRTAAERGGQVGCLALRRSVGGLAKGGESVGSRSSPERPVSEGGDRATE